MLYECEYASPIGRLLLVSDGAGITAIHTDGRRAAHGSGGPIPDAVRWLDVYFSGKAPDFTPPLSLAGTDFRLAVWDRLLSIPYGTTVTYGALAAEIAAARGIPKMSARAIGGAVGHNPVPVIVPCHRVVSADGLGGFSCGLDKKIALLKIERII